MSNSWIKIIEELVVERGVKTDIYYTATLTSGEVLQRTNSVVTPYNHKNILNMVKWHYPQSTWESIGVNGQGGWTFHIKIRTK